MFSRQHAKKLIDRVAEENPNVEELVPKLLSSLVVRKVLQNLLRKRVSIRDGARILEALREAAPITKNTVLLTEYVRQAVRTQVVKTLVDSSDGFFARQITGSIIPNSIMLFHNETFGPISSLSKRIGQRAPSLSRGPRIPEGLERAMRDTILDLLLKAPAAA